jgi:hypothetical protein
LVVQKRNDLQNKVVLLDGLFKTARILSEDIINRYVSIRCIYDVDYSSCVDKVINPLTSLN